MSILDDLFGGGNSKPMDSANQYLNQIPGTAHGGYDPYVKTGLESTDKTKAFYDLLSKDPNAFINNIMKDYKTSEGFNYQKELLSRDLGNTAAAGGIAGTPLDQENRGTQIQKLLAGDQEQFLNNRLNVFNRGLSGHEKLGDRGYDASKSLTDLLTQALNQQGGLAFQNQQQNNKNKNDMWSMFGQALGGGFNLASNPLSLFGKSVWGQQNPAQPNAVPPNTSKV